jgi:hypothetical protein
VDNTLAEFRNILVLILLFAVTLSGFLGHTFEAGAIAVIVLFESSWNFIKITAPKRGNEVFDLFIQPRYGMAAVGDHPTIDPMEKASAFSQQPAYLLTSKGVIL